MDPNSISSIRRQLGLSVDKRTAKPAEAGIAEMIVEAFQTFAQPLTHAALDDWHGMVFRGRTDLEKVGDYRTHAEAMRVISGTGRKKRVHFEAPPSSHVRMEMDRFIDWFNTVNSSSHAGLPIIVRAGIAHLWFESIHPFEDGNGRIGRAITEKALMQGLANPVITSLSSALLERRKEYCHALECASHGLEITDWFVWFASAAIEAGQSGLARVEFPIRKTKLLDGLKGNINPRQKKVLLRMFAAGIDGFKGGLSAKNYASLTDAASATVTRDLSDLMAKGALVRVGERKASRYYLNMPIPASY